MTLSTRTCPVSVSALTSSAPEVSSASPRVSETVKTAMFKALNSVSLIFAIVTGKAAVFNVEDQARIAMRSDLNRQELSIGRRTPLCSRW